MKNRAFFYILLLLVVSSKTSSARPGSVSGKIVDEVGKPVSAVSVILFRSTDSAVLKTELTDEKGEFALTLLDNGNYFIKTFLTGYDLYNSGNVVIKDNDLALPEIKLAPTDTKLKEVKVTAQKAFIEVHADKLVVNVENSIVSSGSSVMEVLQRSPGVSVDQNDKISLKGKQGVTIMIDGRIVPVSAADLANMLKSMSSASVDKVEIISNPSAKYDAAGTAGIINIKTKKDKGMGFNGSVNGSYLQGVYPKENGGINLNFREKKVNIYMNYNANYRVGFSHVTWHRNYFTSGVFNGAYVQDNYSVLSFHTNVAAMGVDYNLTSKTTIGTSVTGENFYLGTKGYYFANVNDGNNQLQSNFATNNTSGGN